MKHADKEKLKARKQWYKDNPEWKIFTKISEWIYSIDKFYSCDGDKLKLTLFLGPGATRPFELFPEDASNIVAPMVKLLSCDDAELAKYFEIGEEEQANDLFRKVIEMQPISFDELRELGFRDE